MKTRAGNNKGFTLIEVVMGLALLALVLVPTVSVFSSAAKTNAITRESIETRYLAESYMEIARGAKISELGDLLEGLGFTSGTFSDYEAGEVDEEELEGEEAEEVEPEESEPGESLGNSYISSDGRVMVAWETDSTIRVENGEAIFHGDFTLSSVIPLFTLRINEENISLFRGNNTPLPGTFATPSGNIIKIRLFYDISPAVDVFVDVFNETDSKLEIYCVNTEDDRNIPTFSIKQGWVAFYDYTEKKDILPEEDNPENGDVITAYRVTVSVMMENDIYELETLKAADSGN